jgi:ribosomal-protein-serine acetyltransferase
VPLPILKTGTDLGLRPLTRADAPAYYACVLENFERLQPWFSWATPALTLADVETEIAGMDAQPEPKRDLPFAFWNGERFGGSIGLYKIDWENRIARIGYWIDAELEGHGLVSRAARALVDYAFSDLKLNRIEIRCAPQNTASRAVPERLGFTVEGTQRDVLALRGGFQDLIMYAMLARDPRP